MGREWSTRKDGEFWIWATVADGRDCGKRMNAARQISRRLDRAMGTRTRSAADYSITATISVVPDPLETLKPHGF